MVEFIREIAERYLKMHMSRREAASQLQKIIRKTEILSSWSPAGVNTLESCIIFSNKELTISCIQDEWHEACGELGSRARINRGHWAEDTCWHRSPGYTGIRPTEENVMESCEPWLSAARSSSSFIINALKIWQHICRKSLNCFQQCKELQIQHYIWVHLSYWC